MRPIFSFLVYCALPLLLSVGAEVGYDGLSLRTGTLSSPLSFDFGLVRPAVAAPLIPSRVSGHGRRLAASHSRECEEALQSLPSAQSAATLSSSYSQAYAKRPLKRRIGDPLRKFLTYPRLLPKWIWARLGSRILGRPEKPSLNELYLETDSAAQLRFRDALEEYANSPENFLQEIETHLKKGDRVEGTTLLVWALFQKINPLSDPLSSLRALAQIRIVSSRETQMGKWRFLQKFSFQKFSFQKLSLPNPLRSARRTRSPRLRYGWLRPLQIEIPHHVQLKKTTLETYTQELVTQLEELRQPRKKFWVLSGNLATLGQRQQDLISFLILTTVLQAGTHYAKYRFLENARTVIRTQRVIESYPELETALKEGTLSLEEAEQQSAAHELEVQFLGPLHARNENQKNFLIDQRLDEIRLELEHLEFREEGDPEQKAAKMATLQEERQDLLQIRYASQD